jgi:hypothetical protein
MRFSNSSSLAKMPGLARLKLVEWMLVVKLGMQVKLTHPTTDQLNLHL